MLFRACLPEGAPRIATERVKWNHAYQKKHGITTRAAKDLPPAVAEQHPAPLRAHLPDPAR